MASRTAYNFKNIPTNATYLVKKGPGTLHTLVINGTAAASILIYDSLTATGSLIATISPSVAIGTSFLYDCEFSIGLTVQTLGASDVTVTYA